jgi:hypothetical protein
VKEELRRLKARKMAVETQILNMVMTLQQGIHHSHSHRVKSWFEYDRATMSIEHINLRIDTAFLLRGAFETSRRDETSTSTGSHHSGSHHRGSRGGCGVFDEADPYVHAAKDQFLMRQTIIDSVKVKAEHERAVAKLIYSAYVFSHEMNKSRRLREGIALLILLNAVLLGVFTLYLHEFRAAWSYFVMIVFGLELCFKLGAEHFRPWRYFLVVCGDTPRSVRIDRVFDTAIILLGCFVDPVVFVCRLGLVGYAFNSKSLRLPALTLISASEVLVYALLMFGWVIYAFACIGVILFGDNDPQHYGALDRAIITQMRMTTLDDWSDIWLVNWLGCDKYLNDMVPEDCVNPLAQSAVSCVFFPTYVLITSYIGLNLLTAIVVTSNEHALYHIRYTHYTLYSLYIGYSL